MRWEKVSSITCLWHCGMRHRGGRTVIQACWWNVGSRRRNAKGNAESDEQGRKCTEVLFCGGLPRSSAEVSVMDMERRGWHTQATEIIQLLNKEEDMMKEAYAQSIECEEPCEGRLSRTVLWEGEGETPSLFSTCGTDEKNGIKNRLILKKKEHSYG